MPVLHNIKHEKLAQAVVKQNKSATRAYQEIYPNATYDTAKNRGNLITKDYDVRQRMVEILNEQGTTKDVCGNKLKELMNHTKPERIGKSIVNVPQGNIQLEATKVALKIHGIEQEHTTTNILNVNNIDNYALQSIAHTLQELNSKLLHTQDDIVDADVIL